MLTNHAKQELELAGLLSPESDYNGEIGKAVMELMEVFAKQGHSGGSAFLTLKVFDKLSRHKTLTPLTSNPDEWFKYTEEMAGAPDCWQSKRCSSVFSKDGGLTWYDIDDPKPSDEPQEKGD